MKTQTVTPATGTKKQPDMNKLRKRVLAAICGYNQVNGVHADNPIAYAKGMACQTMGFTQANIQAYGADKIFNAFDDKELRSLYNTYCKLQKMTGNVLQITTQHAIHAWAN